MVFEWFFSRGSSAERLTQIGRAEAERKQELEEVDRRRRDTYVAIKKWVELPITKFRDKQDTLPLAEKALERSDDIEGCLSRNYPSIWRNLEKLTQEYHEWKSTDSAARFTTIEGGLTVVNITYANKWDDFKIRELLQLHSQLAEQIKSEILGKHDTRLKC